MKLRLWAADTFRFSVQGPEIHRFLNHAAAAGVRLRRVRWQKDGCSAAADGIDRRRLEKIAADGGWVITVTARRGPGRRAEVLLQTRPGLVAGMILFLVLLKFLGGFVWCVDFGAMDADLQPMMRQLLADCAIHEGTRLTKPLLQAAQAKALRRSETFGWISLNFIGGCLSIESTPAQTRTVREPPPTAGLYARADGVILAVEIESGFAAVEPGQTVTAGSTAGRRRKAGPQGKCGDTRRAGAHCGAGAEAVHGRSAADGQDLCLYGPQHRADNTVSARLYPHGGDRRTAAQRETQTEWQPRVWDAWHCRRLCRVTSRERGCADADLPGGNRRRTGAARLPGAASQGIS